MDHYDIVFIGHMATGTIIPFHGPSFLVPGSPLLFASMAASGLGKRVAAATRISERDKQLLEPMKKAGIDLFVKPGEIVEYRVVFPTPNVDLRQPFLVKAGDDLTIDDVPDFEPCLVHICCIGPRDFQIELMRELKVRGFRLSVDMQNFVLQADKETGAVFLQDVPEKKEILSMASFVKLDVMEAQALTGVKDLQEQAQILEDWAGCEIIITSSEGALVRSNGETMFARFTIGNVRGRMGRGDTLIGSYLARRMDYSAGESIRFAAALTSIKMETIDPFHGSMEDVLVRMAGSIAE